MRIISTEWMDYKEWYYFDDNGDPIIKEGAPQKMKESFELYISQCKEYYSDDE